MMYQHENGYKYSITLSTDGTVTVLLAAVIFRSQHEIPDEFIFPRKIQ